MKYEIRIEKISIVGNTLELAIQGIVNDMASISERLPKPKLVLYFDNGKETRRIPFPFSSIVNYPGRCTFYGTYTYNLTQIFWKTRKDNLPTRLFFNFWLGDVYDEKIPLTFENVEFRCDRNNFECKIKDNAILIRPSTKRRNKGIMKSIRAVLTFAYNLVGTVLGILLLPWFFLEALLSFVGVGELSSSIKNDNKIRRLVGHCNQRFASFSNSKIKLNQLWRIIYMGIFTVCRIFPVNKNQIAYISYRRSELSGNFAFVHKYLEKDPSLKMVSFFNKNTSMRNPYKIIQFCYICATSKVILIDEFTPQIHYIDLRKSTRLVQLWHAAGALKTFGFSRTGKPKGSPDDTRNHRSYDYATVSSSYCIKCHSEGFGVDDKVVVPTGIPRTDVFFDEEYAANTRKNFYGNYPELKDKKLIMFAPTFRGMLKEDAYYPFKKFDVGSILSQLDDEYVLLIKHHPFVTEKHPVSDEYKDRVYDFSDSTEINDLLFVVDLIISDYSSLVFEASLLEIPMIFYVFDYVKYVRERDFYFDLDIYAPGKLVTKQHDIVTAIKNKDFAVEKIKPFAEMFFDRRDGKSTQAVVDLIYKALHE
ncbi:MAG: CDP-glycerol glycerophosphotransferase family protein [Coriobacteriia bacterium]|nr:CDP-glycerol glycerophosphotransferase family protein [Coriobacteriia bacterium]